MVQKQLYLSPRNNNQTNSRRASYLMGGQIGSDDGTTIDTGTAVWEIELTQRDRINLDHVVTRYHISSYTLNELPSNTQIIYSLTDSSTETFSHSLTSTLSHTLQRSFSHSPTQPILSTSRIIVIDLPAIDPLVDNPDNSPAYILPSLRPSPLPTAATSPFDLKSRSRSTSVTFHSPFSPAAPAPFSSSSSFSSSPFSSSPYSSSIPLASSTSRSPLLHHAIHTFDTYIHSLLTPRGAALSSFRTSKLTHYLADLLGGNAVVVALGMLTQGQPAVSRKTIEVMDTLSNLRHFPVGNKELTSFVQGVIGEHHSTNSLSMIHLRTTPINTSTHHNYQYNFHHTYQ